MAEEVKPKGISVILKNEDWIAVWIGFFIILAVLVIYNWNILDLKKFNPTFRWTTD